MHYTNPIDFARQLRMSATSSEQILWQFLRNRQRRRQKFRRQHPVGIYTADFFCIEAKLDVELDGTPHETIEGKRKDEIRDAWMRSQGIEVLRIPSELVESDLQQILKRIDEVLDQRCKE